ncbi:LacI family DNA-binding transcriptional regulator [Propioniciclava soli]|uniref:LacI family DNA-binding transcriptional regulator n=1 Tax=Propioniciclava soli TaxID=2775081 RepID=A0ABZ3C9H3_9ACTN|nr:LacI family DNA-binding transcriptional regulator [Propioniciclava soli]
MAKRARLIDVAESAGVSTATVSFVLSGSRSGRTPASPETARRIHEAAAALGYVPNSHAQAMRRGYSTTIVLALGSPEDPWTARVAQEVQRRAHPQGFSTLALVDETWYEFLLGYTPGVALITSTDFDETGLAKVNDLADRGATLVVFATEASADRFDVISSSPVAATRAAYARLRARHDRVHLLTVRPFSDAWRGPSRLAGFRLGAADAGDADAEGRVHLSGWSRDEVADHCHALLAERPRPEAVICSTGYLAQTLRSTALSQGITSPDDLEIIAIGDIPDNAHNHLGPISLYGTADGFGRLADIVVARATEQMDTPFRRHEFVWDFTPGSTTRDE